MICRTISITRTIRTVRTKTIRIPRIIRTIRTIRTARTARTIRIRTIRIPRTEDNPKQGRAATHLCGGFVVNSLEIGQKILYNRSSKK